MSTARIAGVGMIPFAKLGQRDVWDVTAEKAIYPVEGARFTLQRNLGHGGACVVTLYGNVA